MSEKTLGEVAKAAYEWAMHHNRSHGFDAQKDPWQAVADAIAANLRSNCPLLSVFLQSEDENKALRARVAELEKDLTSERAVSTQLAGWVIRLTRELEQSQRAVYELRVEWERQQRETATAVAKIAELDERSWCHLLFVLGCAVHD